MAQRVFSLHRLQSSAGWPTLHLTGGESILCQVFQQPVCQKVCWMQHGHHRSVQSTGPQSCCCLLVNSAVSGTISLFCIISHFLPVIPVCLDDLLLIKCQNNYLHQTGVGSEVTRVLNPGSNPFFVVCIFAYILFLCFVVFSYCPYCLSQ